jgi:hypothetical protein
MGCPVERLDRQIRQAIRAGNLKRFKGLLLEKRDLLMGTFAHKSESSPAMSMPEAQPNWAICPFWTALHVVLQFV